MGSYNVTCAISQLPITVGDPVRVLFLGRSPYSMDPQNDEALGEGNNSREGVYPTEFWYPRNVPLKAVYADYGQVDKVEEGFNQLLFWEQLRTDLWTVEAGPNQYHDPASAFNMDWDAMWDVCAEGRLRIKREFFSESDSHKALPVCAVMVREDVWQAMLALKNPWESHVSIRKGKKISYESRESTLDFYKGRLFKAIKNVLAKPMSDWDRNYAKETGRNNFRYYLDFQDLFLDANNPPGSTGLEFYLRSVIESIEADEFTLDSPEVLDIVSRLAELQHVKSMFSVLRKTWHPGTGKGSQAQEYDACAQFHHAMALVGYRARELDIAEGNDWREKDEPVPTVNYLNATEFMASLKLPAVPPT